MVTVRTVESDDDYEAWRQVRIEVVPYERTPNLEQTKAMARPDRRMVLAYDGGELVGAGVAGNSDTTGASFVAARVRPQYRRRGYGTALVEVLTDHVRGLGHPIAIAHADSSDAVAFAERFGFREVDRQVEQVRAVHADEPGPTVPAGIEIIAVSQRPELWDVAYERVGVPALADMALFSPIHATLEQWREEWISEPEATFLALADGEVIGTAGFLPDEDQPHRAENTLTAVRREWRGRGIAAALKRTALAWAAAHGITEVYTWTQIGNVDMRRLNVHLGYADRLQSITMRRDLRGSED